MGFTSYSLFLGMAFNAWEGKEIKKVWNKNPADIDILITHGPPKGILDSGMGCEELLLQINRVRPKIHCFGHVHGQSGSELVNGTRFINAAMTNNPDQMMNAGDRLVGMPLILNMKFH